MKKTLLALAVMAVAGTANAAATLHDADGVKATVAGSVDVQLIKKAGAKTDIHLRDADVNIGIEVAAGDDLTVFANYELEADEHDAAVTSGDINGGFKGSWGTLTLGEAGDAFSAGANKGKETEIEVALDGLGGKDVIKYAHKVEDVSFAFSYNLGNKAGDASGFAANVSTTFSGVTLKGTASSADGDHTAYGITATYAADAFSAGAAAIQAKTGDAKATDFDLYVGYKAGDTQYYAGFDQGKESGEDAENAYYLNATHTLHANVSLYGEVGQQAEEERALVGFNVKF